MPPVPVAFLLDPADVQILFADLQPPIVARSRTNPPEALACAAGVLAEIGALFGLRMHFTVVPEGGRAPELIPELARHVRPTHLLPRLSASPMLDEATRVALSGTGRSTLLLCGAATEITVLHAACAAVHAGYRVYVPVDACGGLSPRTEDAAFRQIEAAGAVTTSVAGLVTALSPDFGKPPGTRAFEILQTLLPR
ncbi:MAG TPA: isochorismatase family protein [Rhodopila sp.]|jgi:nicotinamidase-related amidase|nr:isochorismatase family protein [Rhodopila sp.]